VYIYIYLPVQLLAKDPTHRLGCGSSADLDIKLHPLFKCINWRRLEAGMMTPPFEPDVRSIINL